MTDEDALWRAVEAEPLNPVPRAALADWLAERGRDDSASALAWMLKHDKMPIRVAYGWRWFVRGVDSGRRHPVMPKTQSWLPEIFGREMSHRYRTLRGAVEHLAFRLIQLRLLIA